MDEFLLLSDRRFRAMRLYIRCMTQAIAERDLNTKRHFYNRAMKLDKIVGECQDKIKEKMRGLQEGFRDVA